MLDRRWLLGCALVVLGCGSGLEDPDPSDEAGLPPGTKVVITGVTVAAGTGGGAGVTSTVTATVTTGAGGGAGGGATVTTGAGGAGGAPPCVPTGPLTCAGLECGMVSDNCGNTLVCGPTTCTSPNGPTCLPNNLCGCTATPQCSAASHLGPICVAAGVCGCNGPGDCTTSPRGRACNASECGCTVVNQAVDCLGVGTGVCDPTFLTCI